MRQLTRIMSNPFLALDEDFGLDKSSSVEEHVDAEDIHVIPVGLPNTRNNCFMNVVVQALAACSVFKEFLCTFDGVNPITLSMKQFVESIGTSHAVQPESGFQLVSRMKNRKKGKKNKGSTDEPCLPSFLVQLLSAFDAYNAENGRRTAGRQEDAHECLQFLLDAMHEELCKGSGEEWEHVERRRRRKGNSDLSFKKSAIAGIFGGRLEITLQKRGTKDSKSFEPFFSISLALASKKGSLSVQNALDQFQAPQRLEGVKNKEKIVSAFKSIAFESTGDVLLVHLKRFAFIDAEEGVQKIERFIAYPLDISLKGEFTLKSVVVHHGDSPCRGHYTVFVKVSSIWYEIDDLQVSKCSEYVALDQNAYILVYERIRGTFKEKNGISR